jgi:maltose O-acetyltransferase
MVAGEPYDPDDSELVAARRRARSLTSEYNDTDPDEPDRRRDLLAELFGATGDGVAVELPFCCDYGDSIAVGDDFFANFDCVVLDVAPVEFGDHCQLGPGVHVYTATHPMDAERRRETESGEPVTVGDDVWIGGNTVINPGVTVGDRAVIGSGAVVTDDVPADTFVGGNPAWVIREIE